MSNLYSLTVNRFATITHQAVLWRKLDSRAQGIAANIHYHVILWTSFEEEWKLKELLPIYTIMFFFGLLSRKNGSSRHCCQYTLSCFSLDFSRGRIIGSSRLKAQGIAAYTCYHIFLGSSLVTLGMIGKARENRGLGLEMMNIHRSSACTKNLSFQVWLAQEELFCCGV